MTEFADKEQQKTQRKPIPQLDTPQRTHHAGSQLRRLQSAVGSQALQRMLADGAVNLGGRIVQPKMTVGAADDQYEQEADAVAKHVMTMPDTVQREEMPEEDEELQLKRIQRQEMPEEDEELMLKRVQREEMPEEDEELQLKRIQRQEMPEEDEELMLKRVQRQEVAEDIPEVSGDVESQINGMSGNGSAMSDSARDFFEPRFGQDFSGVNIHTGAQADQLNRQLNARAFTTGSDIFFRNGEYNPESSGGRELMAHELTHVVQQGGSQAMRKEDD